MPFFASLIIEEIDENFFESESNEIEISKADDKNAEVNQINQKNNINIENELKKKKHFCSFRSQKKYQI